MTQGRTVAAKAKLVSNPDLNKRRTIIRDCLCFIPFCRRIVHDSASLKGRGLCGARNVLIREPLALGSTLSRSLYSCLSSFRIRFACIYLVVLSILSSMEGLNCALLAMEDNVVSAGSSLLPPQAQCSSSLSTTPLAWKRASPSPKVPKDLLHWSPHSTACSSSVLAGFHSLIQHADQT